MRCPPHAWERQGSVCPYGYAVAEVTWPFGEMLHESDEGTVMFMRACAIWSTLPYVVYVFSVVRLCRFRGTRDFNFVFFVLFVSLLNQVVLKRLVHQMRPERSCLTSCGMPSGHTTMAMGLLTLALLDIMQRVAHKPNRTKPRLALGHWTTRLRHGCAQFLLLLSLSPTPTWDELSHFTALVHAVCWIVLLYPVPLARVALHDHTPEQVLAGGTAGFIAACVWWYFAQTLQWRNNHRLGQPVLSVRGRPLFVHDFALPRFVAEQRVLTNPPASLDVQQELSWYEGLTERRLSSAIFTRLRDGDTSVQGLVFLEERRYLSDRLLRLQGLKETIRLRSSLNCESQVS